MNFLIGKHGHPVTSVFFLRCSLACRRLCKCLASTRLNLSVIVTVIPFEVIVNETIFTSSDCLLLVCRNKDASNGFNPVSSNNNYQF